MSPFNFTRRDFVKTATLAASALAFPFIAPRNVYGANSRLNIAGIGVGGKGAVDVAGCDTENIYALCDVDEKNAAGTFKKYPAAKRYKDFRVMLEKEGKSIDAVTVSTPDHTHAIASVMAMRMGKHVYCQKPLTRTIAEARLMTKVARQKKVATQMGNQGHSDSGTRRLVELIQAGVLGKVAEIHCWTDRPIWPQGMGRPAEQPPVPPTLDWDLWLGPAPMRPYHEAYVPFKWRGFWDFGTGAIGDMGCHVMDLPFFSLGLRDPIAASGESPEVNNETAPQWSIIRYDFPARGKQPATKLVWYDGGKKPPTELAKTDKLPGNGVIMVGDKDTLFVPSYWGTGKFLSGAKVEDFKNVSQTLPRAEPFDKGHYEEWITACKGGPKALSNFDYAGPMTEALLLGNIALRVGKRVEWDSKRLRITNHKDANQYVSSKYRAGWKV